MRTTAQGLRIAVGAVFGIASGSAVACAMLQEINAGGATEPVSCPYEIRFSAGSDATSTVTISPPYRSLGMITNATGVAGLGTVVFLGHASVSHNVGAASAGNLLALTAGAGSLQFNSDNQVFVDTTTLNGVSSVFFSNGLHGTTLDFNHFDGEVQIGNGNLDLTTLIPGGGAVRTGSGTLALFGTSVVSGAIGSPTNQLKGLQIDGAVSFSDASQPVYAVDTYGSGSAIFAGGLAGTSVSLQGTLTIGAGKNLAANVASGGTVEFLGSTTVANSLGTSDVMGLGQVIFNAGAVSVGGDIFANNAANSILIGNGVTAIYTANTAFSGRMTLGATGVLDLSTFTVTGATANAKSDLVTVAGSTVRTTLISDVANSAGKMTVDGSNTVIATGTNLVVVVPARLAITNGRRFTIVSAAAGNSVGTVNITDNSAVLNFVQVQDTGNLIIQAVRLSGGYVAAAGLTPASLLYPATTVLDTVAAAGSAFGDMMTVLSTLDGYNSTQLYAALNKAAPLSNSSITEPTAAMSNASIGLSQNRLAGLRGDTWLAAFGTASGVAAGSAERTHGVWLEGLGNWGSQVAKDGFDGYKTQSYGLGLGADTLLTSDWTVGLAFTSANAKVDQQDSRVGDGTTIRSGQLTGYASREFGAAYLEMLMSYADLQFDSRRATALFRTATGSYGGSVWTAKAGGGYRFMIADRTTLIPMASLQTLTLTQQAYTETGADALNLNYTETVTTRTQSTFGARIMIDSRSRAGGDLKFEGRLAWLHDFKDSGTDTTAAFTGGGASFTTNGQKISKEGWQLGAGATYAYGKGTTVALQYDHEGRSGYGADSVQLAGRWRF